MILGDIGAHHHLPMGGTLMHVSYNPRFPDLIMGYCRCQTLCAELIGVKPPKYPMNPSGHRNVV